MTVITPLSRADLSRVGEVYYNGVRFPPAIRSSAKFEPVFDSSRRITKYVKATIRIETYIFPGCLEEPVANQGGIGVNASIIPYRAAQSVDSVGSLQSPSSWVTTDHQLANIRRQLLQPCQRLAFTYQGAGTIVLNNDPSLPGPTGMHVYGPRDVDNGPKPKMLDWKPLTNKMARIVWEVETCYAPCEDVLGNTPSDTAEWTFQVSMAIDGGGLTTRTIEGTHEIGLTRVPTLSTLSVYGGDSEPFDMHAVELKIMEQFPLLKQFKRTSQEFVLSRDRKTVQFTIIDQELPTDDAYGIGIENENVVLEISSGLAEGAFRKWSVTLRGSIEMMAGFPKSFGWVEITRLFHNYIRYRPMLGQSPDFPDSVNPDEIGFPGWGHTSRASAILRGAKFSDEIFGRKINFSFTWDLFVRLKDVFIATGMFMPIDDKEADVTRRWDDWVYAASTVIQDKAGYQDLGFNQNDDIIVSLCKPYTRKKSKAIPPKPKKRNKIRMRGDKVMPDPYKYDKESETALYNQYIANFAINVATSTFSHRVLQAVLPQREKPSSSRKTTTEGRTFTPDTPGVPQLPNLPTYPAPTPQSSNKKPPTTAVHKVGPNQYTVTFRGYAERLGYPPDTPHLKSYGGVPAVKIGTDKIVTQCKGGGIDLASGRHYSIHGTAWEKTYVLNDPPRNSTIETDGYPSQYV